MSDSYACLEEAIRLHLIEKIEKESKMALLQSNSEIGRELVSAA